MTTARRKLSRSTTLQSVVARATTAQLAALEIRWSARAASAPTGTMARAWRAAAELCRSVSDWRRFPDTDEGHPHSHAMGCACAIRAFCLSEIPPCSRCHAPADEGHHEGCTLDAEALEDRGERIAWSEPVGPWGTWKGADVGVRRAA